MNIGLSPLAKPIPALRTPGQRTAEVYGVIIHCTGSGIVSQALTAGADPFTHTVAYYSKPDTAYFAHYVIGYQGEIAQVADENGKASHVGYPQEDRGAFLDGSWASRLPAAYVAAWRARWGARYASPAHLFPGPSVNNVTVGMELLPWQAGCPGVPDEPGLKYTRPQHVAAARLAEDIATRWGFQAGWSRTGRLAGHEDLNPLERTVRGMGWDPGIVRPGGQPWINWGLLVSLLERPVVA